MKKRIFSAGLLLILSILMLHADGEQIQTLKQNQNMDSQKGEVIDEEQLSEQMQNTDEQESEAIKKAQFLKKIQSIDYNVREYPINQEVYDEEMDRTYRKAFYEALTGQIPWEYGEKEEEVRKRYQEFLAGGETAEGITLTSLSEDNMQYAVWEVDGDGLPELHIRTGEWYFIFKVYKEQVFLWKVFEQDEEEKYVFLRNGQILGKIRNTTEGEKEESYYLYQLGISGTEELVFAASYRDENGDGSPDQEDSYEIRENGWKDREWTGCEGKLWLEKTRAFLYTDGEGIQQIRGEVGWLDLRVDPAVNNENTSATGNGNEEPEEGDYSRSYDLIRQGDWSEVEKPEETTAVWEDLDKDPEDYDWIRVDLNGDGIPELVAEEWEKDPLKKEIYFIFIWENGRVKLVYWDDMGAMSFLFRGRDDRLIYEDSSSYMGGQPNYYLCEFDGEWNLFYTEALSLFHFMDDQMSEEEKEALKSSYPLTYGTGGKGVYFLMKRPKAQSGRTTSLIGTEWVEEVIAPEEFFDRYREMTGHDFFQVEEDYSPFNQVVELALVKGKEGYLILGGRQLELLAEMIRQGQEIEPGLPAAEATYYLYLEGG